MAEFEDLRDRNERLASGPRKTELERIFLTLAEGEVDIDVHFDALSMLLVDALLDGDEAALDIALTRLQWLVRRSKRVNGPDGVERRGRLRALVDVSKWGLERVLPLSIIASLERSSHPHRFLQLLAEEAGRSNRGLAEEIAVDETEISRVGRRLVEAGFARKRKVGRTNEWTITPRGVQALAVMESGGVSRYRRPHQQLLGT